MWEGWGRRSPNTVRPVTTRKCRLFRVISGRPLTSAVAALRSSPLSSEVCRRGRSEYFAVIESERSISRHRLNSVSIDFRTESGSPGLVSSSFFVIAS